LPVCVLRTCSDRDVQSRAGPQWHRGARYVGHVVEVVGAIEVHHEAIEARVPTGTDVGYALAGYGVVGAAGLEP
jgi:hypothetical protein